MKTLLVSLTLLFISSMSFSAPLEGEPRVFEVKKEMRWSEVVELFHHSTISKYKGKEDYLEDLQKWNPHIKSETLKPGQRVYVDNPSSPYLGHDYIKALPSEKGLKKKFRLFVSLNPTYQGVDQKAKSLDNQDFALASLLNLSFDGRYNFENSTLILGAMYSSPSEVMSKANGTKVEESEYKPNSEFTFYAQHELSLNESKFVHLVYGLNYESFNSIDQVQSNLSFENYNTAFATAGLLFKSSYKSFLLHTKVTGSYSVFGNNGTYGSYTGFRGGAEFTILNSLGYTLNTFAKYQSLSNNEYDRTNLLFGLGFGYFIF